ncbi:MAG: TIGR03618 family F420-dependent PPOX class oxidoreductase [Streptosporangiales bacterium]|nr:TIGR03618 family F420-dependent PPOX class oxidoreductase [Streptosporangiales bacterium]
MDLASARDFCRTHHRAVLATHRRDGLPQMSPVTVGVDAAGDIVISTRQAAVKARNLRRDPRASLVVMTDRFFGEWVQIEGTAEIIELPEAMEPLVDYYRSISGEHPDWDDYRRAMERDERVLVKIKPLRAGPNVSG